MDKDPTKRRKNAKQRTSAKQNETDNNKRKASGKSVYQAPVKDREEMNRVQEELNKKYVGAIKIRMKYCTTEWGEEGAIKNRAIDRKAVDVLVEEFKKDLNREDPRHRIKVTLDTTAVANLLRALNISKDDLRACADKSHYLEITDEIFEQIGAIFVVQAGQHRLHAVAVVRSGDNWWIADVYESGLSLPALDYLRINAKVIHTPCNDGQLLLQLVDLTNNRDRLEKDLEMNAYKRAMKKEEFTISIHNKMKELGNHRAQQFWVKENVRKAVCSCLDIPGFRDSLYISNIHGFLSLRIEKVVFAYFTC
jgi:hypothetical protein